VARRSNCPPSPRGSDGSVEKTSALSLERVQETVIKFFHQTTCDQVVSADKMMIHARGPVWHRQQPKQGIIPEGLTGLDTEATWSDSQSDGWVYGPGTFCMVAGPSRLLGACKWRRNRATAAKRLWLEPGK
jgi:hypothetical protein